MCRALLPLHKHLYVNSGHSKWSIKTSTYVPHGSDQIYLIIIERKKPEFRLTISGKI